MHLLTNPIPVEPYPLSKTYRSLGSAIRGSNIHPRQRQSLSDTEQLAGASLANAWWSDSDFVLSFSCGQYLHIYVKALEVGWKLLETKPAIVAPRTIGATPLTLRWPRDVGDLPMDCSRLIVKRIGRQLTRLFVNEMGLWVYMESHRILVFSALKRTDTGQSILHVCEDE